MVNSGLEAFNFTDHIQQVLFYTKMFMLCILDFLLYEATQHDNNNGRLRALLLTSQFSIEWMKTFFEQR